MLPLLLLVVVSSARSELGDPPLLVVPAEGNYSWRPIPISQLRCPPRYLTKKPDKDSLVSVRTVRFDYDYTSDAMLDGYLCHKVEWAVLCSTNFLNQHSFQYALTPQKVTEIECKEAIHQYEAQGRTDPHFPSPNCGWMRESWTELSFVEITPHQIHYDPYTGSLLDPQFVGGRCRASPCLCIHNGTMWIGGQKEPQLCKRQVEGTATLAYDPKGKTKDMTVFGAELRPISLAHACRLNFCEREGFRLETGDFIQIRVQNSPMIASRLNMYSRRCEEGKTVGLHSSSSHTQAVDLALIDEQDRLSCIQTSLVIMSTNKASPTELTHFSPRFPGNGIAYRIHMNQLEAATVHYVGVYKLPSNSTVPNLIGYSHNDTPLYWKDWVPPNKTTDYLTGPNGLLKNPRGKIIIPDLEALYQYYDLAITMAHDIHPIQHPGLRILSNFTDELPIIHRSGGQDNSVGGVLSEFFQGIGGKISGFLLGCILIIGLICVLKLCLKKCINRSATAKVNPPRLARRSSSRWRNYRNSPV